MKQHMEMVEFGVAGLEDVRILLKRWKAVLAYPVQESGPSMIMQTHRQVTVEVEDRRPGEEVLLSFLAPKEVLERFLADLRKPGAGGERRPPLPGVLLTCRLKPRNLQ